MKLSFNVVNYVRDAYKNRNEPESLRLFAGTYWRTMLLTGCVLVIVAFVYGLWNLFSILDDLGAAPTSLSLPVPAFDRATLNATVQALDARQTQFDALKAHPPAGVADPSK